MKSNKLVGIYKIECLNNECVYIGQSINLKDRIAHHLNKLKRGCSDNHFLQEDFNKYGGNNFKIDIIEICNKCDLIERETYWINYYGGIESNNTYNQVDMNGYNRRFKQARSGKNNYWSTHKISKESIEKMRNSKKGKLKGASNPNFKYDDSFIDYLIKLHETMSYKQIASLTGINRTTVGRLIKYRTTTVY